MYAWEMGVKTTYYLRTLAISQVEKSTVNINEFGTTHRRDFTNNPVNANPVNNTTEVPNSGNISNIQQKQDITSSEQSITNLPPQPPKSNIFAVIEGQICESCQ
jgi:ribonucleotide reductase alpha subunit